MFLLEHDAKALLATFGVGSPEGCLVESVEALEHVRLPSGPWIVKAQAPVGGRGKAGLVRFAATPDELAAQVAAMLGAVHRGHRIASCRIERKHEFRHELYVGFMLDAETGGVRALLATSGGVDIELSGSVRSKVVEADAAAMSAALVDLASDAPELVRAALSKAAPRLARAFASCDALLLEINPLFVLDDGAWLAADAKMVVDDNAIARQPEVARLLEARAPAYVETYTKWKHGFDYVVVDPQGELGLLTTGAGLSMMLIDELRAAGMKPYNFLDVRTGGLRGDATRLVQVLHWIAQGPGIRCVLVNVFAGITHLGEFSRLLVEALERSPQLKVPVVTRLVGNGLDEARAVLGAAGIAVEPDLNKALVLVRAALGREPGAQM